MRRVVGAVCIGHKSGSTNFLLQATANKVSRRALLNHHFVVPLLRWRMLLRILCVQKPPYSKPLQGTAKQKNFVRQSEESRGKLFRITS